MLIRIHSTTNTPGALVESLKPYLKQLTNPHYSCAILLQSPIRCCDEPSVSGLAPRTLIVLLGTGALLFGACPRLRSGTGTAADSRASPLRSARWSRDAAQRFCHEPS